MTRLAPEHTGGLAQIPAGGVAQKLVDRATEPDILCGQLRDLVQRRGGVVLVAGEARSGTSGLLRAMVDRLDSNIKLVWAAGDVLGQAFPLLPLADAVGSTEHSGISALLRDNAANSATVADAVLAASRQLPAWVDDLCSVSPLVLILDDPHWADSASVHLWHRLTRKTRQLPLLLAGAMRPGHDQQDLAALRRRMIDIRAVGRAALIDLEPLTSNAVTELITILVGGKPARRLSELAVGTRGNRFYITELMSALAHAGALIGTNVSHVLAKLSLRSRVDIARVVSNHS
ncbi:AAA ATPase domain-containing protein [Lentzea waywayandensis]|uniref:AAA ATPase domain-containing protein n=1 Tax=Lentzea waywayandensis TaxID=84724 RepID=A0A1I6D3M1_9PSEU|nr:AAA family ATPase [Lentzea waywayandensis]SFR00088.1 AAA ATPase domain-containing protein [Lentzea waywayandensis]